MCGGPDGPSGRVAPDPNLTSVLESATVASALRERKSMEKSCPYRVLPQPPRPTSMSDDQRRGVTGLESPGCSGFLLWIALVVVLVTAWGSICAYL